MTVVLAVGWDINPLMFLEFFFVLAFGIGWLVLEYVAKRADERSKAAERDDDGDDAAKR